MGKRPNHLGPILIGIYLITSPSGRKNVGQSWDINKRKQDYKYGKCKGQSSLYSSFQKYGPENHTFEILEVIQERATEELTQLELNEREIFFIAKFNTRNKEFGMNLKEGGSYGKHSEESKIKMSVAQKGKKRPLRSEETKRKQSIALTGRIVSPETKAKQSASKLGKPNPKIAGEKNGMAKRGHTEKTKLKMSLDRKGKVAPNRIYATGEKHPLYGKFGKDNSRSKKIVQIDLITNESIKVWDSMSDAERGLGIHKNNISAVCRGKEKTAGGFKWEYYVEENNLIVEQ